MLLPDGYRVDARLDLSPDSRPLPDGAVVVTGLSRRDGVPVALVVDESRAEHYRRAAENRRRDAADRRRLTEIFDDPRHAAEKADLLRRLNEPIRARLADSLFSRKDD